MARGRNLREVRMRRYLMAVTTAASVLGLPDAGTAQDPALELLGLRGYVSEVLDLNAGIDARRARLVAATERIEPAGALPDPSITAGVISVPAPSFDFEAEPMTQLQLGLQQTFPFPGKRDASATLARADSAVASADLDRLEVDLAAAAAAAFFDLAYALTTETIWRDRLRVAEIGVSIAESRYQAGEVAQTDVLRARLDRARVEERLDGVAAARSAASARADALRGGGGPPFAPAPLVNTAGAPAFVPLAEAVPDLESAVAGLSRSNPRLKLVERQVERAQRQVQVLEIAHRPDFSASLGTGIRFGGRDPFVTAMIGVPVPIWSGRKQTPTARASALDSQAIRRELDDLRADLEARVRSLHAELASLRIRIERFGSEIVPVAEAANASAMGRYRVGGTDFATVLDTQDDLDDARLSLALLVAEYGARRAEMAGLIGEEWYR